MAEAARAYAYPRRERTVAPAPQPRINVVPGAGAGFSTLSAGLLVAARIVALVIVLATLAGLARIWLSTETVTTSMASQEIESEIAEIRSAAATLEVQQSTLSSPSRVKAVASGMGMAAPAETTTIVLSPDVVATNESGDLSLAMSLKRAAAIVS